MNSPLLAPAADGERLGVEKAGFGGDLLGGEVADRIGDGERMIQFSTFPPAAQAEM